MADGSPEDRTGPKQMNDLTFSAPGLGHGDTKKCSGETFNGDRVKLSFYTELDTSESCKKSDTRGVAADRSTAVVTTISQKSREADAEDGDDRKKRCFDRYDSSESSDSGIAVLSPTESSGCSSSDITEPRSPRSPESSCSNTEDSTGVGTRMPPWASEPAPPAQRRLPAQPAPRRSQPPVHRRITEYFNHKMKPQNGLKRDSNSTNNEDTKRKCLPKNGVTHDLEKYISYLSQTLNPKVLMDVGKSESTAKKANHSSVNGVVDVTKATDLSKIAPNMNINGMLDFSRVNHKDKSYTHTNMNGFVEVRHGTESFTKEKPTSSLLNGLVDGRKKILDNKVIPDPSAKCTAYTSSHTIATKRKMHHELNGVRIAPATSASHSSKKPTLSKADTTRINGNGVVSSTTKMDSRMNGVTCGSNNLSLHSKTTTMKKEAIKKTTPLNKRTNRKSSACIANSKNLTWSKANNLKQVQLQQQNCVNSTQGSPIKNIPGEPNTTPKMSIPNGVRQVPMTMNGNLGNLNVPVTNFQNCHQINIPQQCNGSVNSNNLASFVAVPQNVMLTTLRIPQNGIPAQTLTQQSNMNAYNRQNVSVTSPTKLNGQFVFPLMQNINGAVVQIPNLMAKMPNFVLPQTSQLTAHPGQEHLQNQQAAQILINGTLLKLANTMTSGYTNVNKTGPVTSQSIPVMNKDVQGMPPVGMKPNYAVNLSQSVFMPQPGFIVTSVPNMNVKETWSYTSTNMLSSPQSSCSNTIMHHPPHMVPNFTAQTLHSSSMPIAPVKPPENPIQGTEPPSSTVKEPNELNEVTSSKCDIPWLSKTVNNNIVPFATNKIPLRAFAEVSFSDKLNEFAVEHKIFKEEDIEMKMEDSTGEDFNKIEEVARREETLFTQITVLKDVSSNVQSSMIEANFCCTTTESSESGIGTDKSIDSPSDSQTSKDCDDDSSLSLSVSVCSMETQSSQKSPILKQPKTLRFPPRNPVKSGSDKRKSSTETSAVTLCLWEDCKKEFDDDTDLLEHLQSVHVESQAGKENYVCLWQQCKVRGKPSCSSLWLQRHALSHTGRKPFKCIVDGCDRRFSTQNLLERHVNNHFNEASPGSNGIKKTSESGSKLMRRNGKKLRYRRQPWSARMFDFFDSSMMEGLAWRLARCTRWRLGGACPLREGRGGGGGRGGGAGSHTLALTAAVAATRYNAAHARREALVQYYPPHVLEDEWVPEKEVTRVKRVEIASLPAATKVLLFEQFCASYRRVDPPQRRVAAVAPKIPNNVKKNAPRHCTSSRLLNNLLAKQKRTELRPECRPDPLLFADPLAASANANANEVTGAKKRKQGRRHGGVNAFLPSGR